MIYYTKITHEIQLQLWQLNAARSCWDIIFISQWLEWDRVESMAFSDTPHYGATGSFSQWVMSLWRASGMGCSVCMRGNGKWSCRWVVKGGKETEGKGGEEPSMQSREWEIEMWMCGEGREGDSEKGNLDGAVDWDGGGGRKENIKRVVLSWC